MLLLIIASLLFNLCLLVSVGYDKEFDQLHEELNEGVACFVLAGLKSEIDKFDNNFLSKSTDIEDYEIDSISLLNGSFSYGDNLYKTVTIGISESDSLNKKVQKYEIIDKSEGSGVFLPYEFMISDNYHVGDD